MRRTDGAAHHSSVDQVVIAANRTARWAYGVHGSGGTPTSICSCVAKVVASSAAGVPVRGVRRSVWASCPKRAVTPSFASRLGHQPA